MQSYLNFLLSTARGWRNQLVPGLVAIVLILQPLISPGFAQEKREKDQEKLTADTLTKKEVVFFENNIRPLLSKNCYSCHGSKKQESDLRLDSREAMLVGGDSGEAIVPGAIDESLLIEVIEREEDQMPPGKHLSPEEITALKKWVEIGAPWPATTPDLPAFSKDDRSHWAFQDRKNVTAKKRDDDAWSRNELDYFVFRNFRESQSAPLAEATKRQLMRRLYFNLVGVPPNIDEQRKFLNDDRPDAYERLVDRLLDDSRYGEKWARHWLDLVRYAESDGYKQDDFRPNAWRYRDYVIRSLNNDKPYDQFVREQLAGDELDPNDPEHLIATGYLRHWIYEYNQRDVRTQWNTILNDVTNVTGDVFLAMSMNCARCHDHKFDPVLQEDYFRLRAFFAPMLPRDDIYLATQEEKEKFLEEQEIWLEKTADIRKQIEAIESPHHAKKMQPEINKFPLDIRPMMAKKLEERNALELQLSDLAYRQVKKLTKSEMEKRLKGDQQAEWKRLNAELAKFDSLKPKPLPKAFTVTDVSGPPPATYVPDDKAKKDIVPGALLILNDDIKVERVSFRVQNTADELNSEYSSSRAGKIESTGRRLALANWIASSENPLTARVIVNRIWQQHFGAGIVGSPSDFGNLGDQPADPLLLDWLANRFVRDGWKFKSLHRLILTSATYRQQATVENVKKLQPFRVMNRRLQAEQIRDAMLATSGELNTKAGGPSADRNSTRRTVYTKVIRNNRDPLLDVFDAPDNFNSTAQRSVTTTPNQSLLMMNGDWTGKRSRAFANRLSQLKTVEQQITHAYLLAYSRLPTATQLVNAREFLLPDSDQKQVRQDDLIDFCHILLNSNEFIYVD